VPITTDERITHACELTIRVESSALGHVVFLSGELDGASATILESELLNLEQDDVKQITIDLGGLSFVDSTGLAVLLRMVERSQRDPSRVAFLRSRNEGVQRLLALTAVDELIPFID
jgi:anti-sigma B factor antagonist